VRVTLSGEIRPLAEMLSGLEFGKTQIAIPFIELNRRGAVPGQKGPRPLAATVEATGFILARNAHAEAGGDGEPAAGEGGPTGPGAEGAAGEGEAAPTGENGPSGDVAPTGEAGPTGEGAPTGAPAPTGDGAPTGEATPTGEGGPAGEGAPIGEKPAADEKTPAAEKPATDDKAPADEKAPAGEQAPSSRTPPAGGNAAAPGEVSPPGFGLRTHGLLGALHAPSAPAAAQARPSVQAPPPGTPFVPPVRLPPPPASAHDGRADGTAPPPVPAPEAR
jgi:hypothetical protein